LLQGLQWLLRWTDKETFKNESKRACEKHRNASIETFGNRGTHPRIQPRIRLEEYSDSGLETNYNKKLISEMIHIKEQKNSINLQTDTEMLDSSYFCLLDVLANNKIS